MTYRFKLRRKVYTAESLAQLSQTYEKVRDDSGEGGSTFPRVDVFDHAGNLAGYISYNGRIWPGSRHDEWNRNATPIYDNRTA